MISILWSNLYLSWNIQNKIILDLGSLDDKVVINITLKLIGLCLYHKNILEMSFSSYFLDITFNSVSNYWVVKL